MARGKPNKPPTTAIDVRAGGWALILLSLAALVPASAASPASGELVVTGPIRLPPRGALDAEVLALFNNDTASLSELTFVISEATVTRLEQRVLTAGGAGVGSSSVVLSRSLATYTLTNLTIDLAPGDHRGWMGIYPNLLAASVDVDGITVVEPQQSSHIGNVLDPEPHPNPGLPFYSWSSDRPVLTSFLVGRAELTGSGSLKLMGPDVSLRAAENTTLVATGITQARPPIDPERDLVQLFITFPEGSRASYSSSSGVEIAASLIQTTSTGAISLRPISGEISTGDETYSASDRGEETLTGNLTLIMRAANAGGAVATEIQLEGDLASASLLRRPLPGPSGSTVNALLTKVLIAIALVTVGGGGAYLIARRSRRPHPQLDIDELVDLARQAAEREDFALALSWIRRAQAQAPSSGRLRIEEAFFLGALGDVNGALAAYDAAARIESSGDAELQAARLLAGSGGEEDEVRERLSGALERSPILALEIDDGTFERFEAREWYRSLVSRARRRFENQE